MNLFTSALRARPRVVEIGENKALSLYLPVGSSVHGIVGTLWITQEGCNDDFVVSHGEKFDVRGKGQIVVSALGGNALAYLAPEGEAGPAVVASSPEVLDALTARAIALRRRELTRVGRLALHALRLALRQLKAGWRRRKRTGSAIGQPSH